VPPKTGLAKLLAEIAPVLDRWCDGWYLFGAQAVTLFGRPRFTNDVDLTIRLRTADPTGFCQDMKSSGFSLRTSDPEDFLRRTRVLPFLHVPTNVPVDVVLAGPGPEETFLQRAVIVGIEGVQVPVASPEDLVVMKILAARVKDQEDAQGILDERMDRLDLSYIKSTLSMLEEALSQSDLIPAFERALLRASRRRS
jgi:hypothetical protein